MDDTAEELGPAAFGNLLHDVLKRFGEDPIHTSTDPESISRFLNHTLSKLIDMQYGKEHLPAVAVQLVQARQRLAAFAQWQARRAACGWEIVHTETSGGDQPIRLNIDAETSVILRGRIDRIDHKAGKWAIFDYKTGDKARSPQETHYKASNWIDLQLPLYVELAHGLGITGPLQLGYINLPKELDKVGDSMAPWDEDMLESAVEEARDVAGKIVAGKFWPPTRPASGTVTEFAAICQEHAFRPLSGRLFDGATSMTRFPHILIRASAGTGKTFRLSNRYLELLHSGVAPDQILATTFTRKAAGEILDRVVVRLAAAALEPAQLAQLSQQLQLPSLTHEKCLELLKQLIDHLHRLRVSTLDAFFAQLAGSFSLELGLPPGWRIVEQLHDKYLRREAITLTLQGDTNREIQRLVHLMAKGEATRSISDLVQSTVDNLYDLYIETDAAAWQRIPRPRLLASESLAATIEALRTAPLPADSRATKARDSDVEAAEQGDWERFIGKGLTAKILAGETTYFKKDIPPETIDLYSQLLNHARGVLLHQVADQTEATYQLLDKFHTAYAYLKRKARPCGSRISRAHWPVVRLWEVSTSSNIGSTQLSVICCWTSSRTLHSPNGTCCVRLLNTSRPHRRLNRERRGAAPRPSSVSGIPSRPSTPGAAAYPRSSTLYRRSFLD